MVLHAEARHQPARLPEVIARLRARLAADRLVGTSQALAGVLEQVSLVAPLKVGVLLEGPSGTGKTLVARTIHDSGPRATCPFVEINCAAVPEALIESELFGADAGSHSTAQQARTGRVAAAEAGTLFLDEIGELPLLAQAKLLQLLQSRTYFPLGRSTPVSANVRIIAATNADLREKVERREFRADLFHRLNVVPIQLPSVAERREDIVDIASSLVGRFAASEDLPPLSLSAGARVALELREWRGNIREIENTVARGLIRAHAVNAPQIDSEHLFPEERRAVREGWHAATRRFQRLLLARALEEEEGDTIAVAARLEIARSSVYNLKKMHDL